ncbi:excinuclease ABC subunit C [Candidatus Pacearchaeota archaeon]|nr:MAG: excinuclease ABC subunit C [Candidatus Pacearchaeota archaeon]
MDLQKVPNLPGCYLFKDKNSRVIYVGKAKNLRKRVSSYFRKGKFDAKTLKMIENISDISFFVTDNEVEALVLENNLIKKYVPRYNLNLRDAKRYAYIKITNEKYPRLIISRRRDGNGEFFGPFVLGGIRDKILETLQKAFQIRTCKRLPKRACLRFFIGACTAPCINKISHKDYLKNISMARNVLLGKTADLKNELNKKMKELASLKNFEAAIIVREQLRAINEIEEKQKVERSSSHNEDIINFKVFGNRVLLIVFSSSRGVLEKKSEFEFEASKNFIEEFLLRYYSENPTPEEIILPKKIRKEIMLAIERICCKKIKFSFPKKGDKKKLLDLVMKNIDALAYEETGALEKLKEMIGLEKMPHVIECFDVSHLAGTDTVASMVQFIDGKPNKEGYRRFKLRDIEGIDDFASIRSVVTRRYKRLMKESAPLPDLIVIDGGAGQLSSAIEAMASLGCKIPIISIAKREEEIYIPGKKSPLKLEKKNEALKLLQRIRDEAHRFAISYNRLLRKKRIRQG